MINVIGWTGSLLLACCSIPLSYECYQKKRCDVGYPFLMTWFFGELLAAIYVIWLKDYALITNYTANIIFLFIIIYYKIFRK